MPRRLVSLASERRAMLMPEHPRPRLFMRTIGESSRLCLEQETFHETLCMALMAVSPTAHVCRLNWIGR